MPNVNVSDTDNRYLYNNLPTTIILGDVKEDGSPDISQKIFEFPVPHKQMRIKQKVRIDEIEVPGRSGKIKQATGFEDTEVDVTIDLVDHECNQGTILSVHDQLAELQQAFRSRNGSKIPRIFSVSSPLTDTCGIKTVLFKGMEVEDLPGTTTIKVTISLVEFEPVAVQVEKNAARAKVRADAKKKAKTVAAKSPVDAAVAREDDPIAASYLKGKSDAMGGTRP